MDGVHPDGGSRVLIELIDEYADALMVDLRQYYQLDLRDAFLEEGALSPRYLLAMIVNLPLGSAFVAAKRGGSQYRGWDESRYALVALINAVRTHNHLFVVANSDPKKKQPDPPEPYPTPDDDTEEGRALRARLKGPPARGSFAHVALSMMQRTKRQQAKAGD